MGKLGSRLATAIGAREREFLSLLEEAGANCVDAADRLDEYVHFFPARQDLAEQVKRQSAEGRRLNDTITSRLNATFVTPIERDDLQAVSAALDALTAWTATFADLLEVYLVERVRHPAPRLTQLVLASAREIDASLPKLRQVEDVASHTGAIRGHVDDGLELVRAGLRELFVERPEPIELVRWRDLFERFENALRICERAATALDAIAVKRS